MHKTDVSLFTVKVNKNNCQIKLFYSSFVKVQQKSMLDFIKLTAK